MVIATALNEKDDQEDGWTLDVTKKSARMVAGHPKVMGTIFAYLDGETILSCRLMCHRWKKWTTLVLAERAKKETVDAIFRKTPHVDLNQLMLEDASKSWEIPYGWVHFAIYEYGYLPSLLNFLTLQGGYIFGMILTIDDVWLSEEELLKFIKVLIGKCPSLQSIEILLSMLSLEKDEDDYEDEEVSAISQNESYAQEDGDDCEDEVSTIGQNESYPQEDDSETSKTISEEAEEMGNVELLRLKSFRVLMPHETTYRKLAMDIIKLIVSVSPNIEDLQTSLTPRPIKEAPFPFKEFMETTFFQGYDINLSLISLNIEHVGLDEKLLDFLIATPFPKLERLKIKNIVGKKLAPKLNGWLESLESLRSFIVEGRFLKEEDDHGQVKDEYKVKAQVKNHYDEEEEGSYAYDEGNWDRGDGEEYNEYEDDEDYEHREYEDYGGYQYQYDGDGNNYDDYNTKNGCENPDCSNDECSNQDCGNDDIPNFDNSDEEDRAEDYSDDKDVEDNWTLKPPLMKQLRVLEVHDPLRTKLDFSNIRETLPKLECLKLNSDQRKLTRDSSSPCMIRLAEVIPFLEDPPLWGHANLKELELLTYSPLTSETVEGVGRILNHFPNVRKFGIHLELEKMVIDGQQKVWPELLEAFSKTSVRQLDLILSHSNATEEGIGEFALAVNDGLAKSLPLLDRLQKLTLEYVSNGIKDWKGDDNYDEHCNVCLKPSTILHGFLEMKGLTTLYLENFCIKDKEAETALHERFPVTSSEEYAVRYNLETILEHVSDNEAEDEDEEEET